MKKIITSLLVASSLFLLLWVNGENLFKPSVALATEQGDKLTRIFSIEEDYADAKQDLLDAIADKGLVVSYTAHAKKMFDRTAKVTGEKTPVYDHAEIVLFCKADLSQDLVQANPHNLILCPYAIAIYVLHKEPKRVYLSFREQDKSQPVTKPITQLLQQIIDDVI